MQQKPPDRPVTHVHVLTARHNTPRALVLVPKHYQQHRKTTEQMPLGPVELMPVLASNVGPARSTHAGAANAFTPPLLPTAAQWSMYGCRTLII
jgi:hypothetical protein